MAYTASRNPEPERNEAPTAVDRKAQELADLIRKSKHFIVLTGAGISTSAGIPDFRGPQGHWTLQAQGKPPPAAAVSTEQAIPTPSHMAIVELLNRGFLKYLISQNCDGLHRRSAIHPDKLSELHGNSNLEYCRDCKKEYLRDFRAVASDDKPLHDHRTGRKCVLCGGVLVDSIIHFGEDLPAIEVARARKHAKKADLCLVLGSSLTVSPSNEMPETVGSSKNGELVICNLQSTPLDDHAALRVFCKTDDLMQRVMNKLDLPIPPFILRRHLTIAMEKTSHGRHQLRVSGVDVEGTPMSFLRSVGIPAKRRLVQTEPFVIQYRDAPEPGTAITLELEFMGHYFEPKLDISYMYGGDDHAETSYLLEYDPQTGEWRTSVTDDIEVMLQHLPVTSS